VNVLWHFVRLSTPLYGLVALGYLVASLPWWRPQWSGRASRAVFSVALPAMLFQMMSHQAALPAVDARVLVAYFGSCLIVFFIGRATAGTFFAMDGVAQSVFALGGIFSNNLLLGLPLARTLLGDASIPVVSLVLVFNSFLLWMLVTVSVEWARHRSASIAGLARTAKGVLGNPIVASILAGTAFGFAGLPLPAMIDRTLDLIGQAAVPLSLIALGMGLAQYGIREGARTSVAICLFKLIVHPAVVAALAWALALPPLETAAIVLLAALPVGANVYLMARQFDTLRGPIAGSLVLSTAVAAATTPVLLALAAQLLPGAR
jgi:malonate transporter